MASAPFNAALAAKLSVIVTYKSILARSTSILPRQHCEPCGSTTSDLRDSDPGVMRASIASAPENSCFDSNHTFVAHAAIARAIISPIRLSRLPREGTINRIAVWFPEARSNYRRRRRPSRVSALLLAVEVPRPRHVSIVVEGFGSAMGTAGYVCCCGEITRVP